MKSLERRFSEARRKNPEYSSIICFAEAVCGQNFSRDVITKWFGLVDKTDYLTGSKKEIVDWLEKISRRG